MPVHVKTMKFKDDHGFASSQTQITNEDEGKCPFKMTNEDDELSSRMNDEVKMKTTFLGFES